MVIIASGHVPVQHTLVQASQQARSDRLQHLLPAGIACISFGQEQAPYLQGGGLVLAGLLHLSPFRCDGGLKCGVDAAQALLVPFQRRSVLGRAL